MGCCYQLSVVTNRVLLPTGCCYHLGVVTNCVVINRLLLPTGCCYQPVVVTNRLLLPTRCCYQLGAVTNHGFQKHLLGKNIQLLKPRGWKQLPAGNNTWL